MPRSPRAARPFAPGLTRRDFVKLGAGALAGAWMGVRPAAAASQDTVLVLGAGMAGLAAARRLVDDFGYSAPGRVIVLEARRRTGGRIHSSTDLGTPIDLGATWIHGIQGNPVSALADRYGAGRRATNYDSFRVYDSDGRLFASADVTRLEGVEENILDEAATYGEDELDEDQSLAATLADIGAGAGLSARDRRILS